MRESRLKFTEKERLDPVMGKAVQKAEKAADKAEKAQAKIPTKKVIKQELMTDNSNGKIKVKLHFEDMEKKPPSQLKVTARLPPQYEGRSAGKSGILRMTMWGWKLLAMPQIP